MSICVEAGGGELARVLVLLERAGDAADPQLHAAPHLGRHLAANHDVGDREAAAGLEHAEGFAQHAILVGREIDHAVGDDHVDGVVGQRDVLDLALQELDVLDAGLALILSRQRQHLVGHVEAVGLARRTDAPGRQQHVDAAARAEVEHGLAGFQLAPAPSDCRSRARLDARPRAVRRSCAAS